MDTLTPNQRSRLMSKIRGKNTGPELLLRRYLWKKGVRGYRLHAKLPGRPDLYFGPQKVAVFVDGCFWHKCPLCYRAPKSNRKFWNAKIKRNIARDLAADVALGERGVKSLRFWEHEVKENTQKCYRKIQKAIA
jgi:DNA mismatch endonuclease, patch repair protein